MKITGVSTVVVDAGDRDWVFVRVRTDEPGLVGWGESSLGWQTHAVVGAVRDLEPLLVGQDPRSVERHWQTMTRGLYFKGGIVTMSAVSGIDQALWDIKARALGVPLYELLGGPVRDRVRTYVNLGSELGGDARRPEAWSHAAAAAREAGFDAMKAYPATPARPLEGQVWLRQAVALVTAVREGAGDDADVMVDLHGRTTPAMAIQLGRALEPLRPWFLEEPCQPGSVDAMVEVARALPIPIATGERLVTRNEFREHLERRACAVLQPNVCYCGGVSEVRRIAAMAETALVSIAPHNPNGPIGAMVSVHLALALPNFLILEQVRGDVPWRREVVDRPLDAVDGYVLPPTRPGIGVEIVEEVVEAHPGGSPRPHLEYAPDGSLLDW
ncbi:MAG TPA: galactonate dehydratase [Actinomycetota bacterium]|nr:galactonate dehydratase [Actinomycetota bacterium]